MNEHRELIEENTNIFCFSEELIYKRQARKAEVKRALPDCLVNVQHCIYNPGTKNLCQLPYTHGVDLLHRMKSTIVNAMFGGCF